MKLANELAEAARQSIKWVHGCVNSSLELLIVPVYHVKLYPYHVYILLILSCYMLYLSAGTGIQTILEARCTSCATAWLSKYLIPWGPARGGFPGVQQPCFGKGCLSHFSWCC